MNKIKCSNCNMEKDKRLFLSASTGRVFKQCERCRELKRKNIKKCEHGRQKHLCKECGGSSICEHGGARARCKKCNGVEICEHKRRRQYCKDCGGSQICAHDKQKHYCKYCGDPKKITIKQMLYSSRYSDIKKERYDANNFIDKCFIETLMDETMNCHYCKIEMQLTEFNDTLCTIERLDNSIGHIKSNCVLVCKKCNLKHQF